MSAHLVYVYVPRLVNQQSIEQNLINSKPVKAVVQDQHHFHSLKVYWNLQYIIKFLGYTLSAPACLPSYEGCII
jgi:hypothetical protein